MLDQKAMSNQAGKGDDLRPVNGDKFRSNYDKIFKKHESNPIDPNARNLEPGQREVLSRRHFRANWKQPS
jgi:hypothetical protein